jgi:hypothetical protein
MRWILLAIVLLLPLLAGLKVISAGWIVASAIAAYASSIIGGVNRVESGDYSELSTGEFSQADKLVKVRTIVLLSLAGGAYLVGLAINSLR